MYSEKQYTQLRLDGPGAYVDHPIVPPKFTLKPYQNAVDRALSIHGTSDCIIASHNTGSGKTRTGNTVGENFIATRTALERQENPLVYIIGYTAELFIRDLLRRPSSGFVTVDEIARRQHLQQVASQGTEDDRTALREFESRLKRRLGNPKYGGHYRFIGYKELFNLLFIDREQLQPGKMVLNIDLLGIMAGCQIICDETQLLYNQQDTNNHGLALRCIRHLSCEPRAAQAWTGKISDEVADRLARLPIKWLHLTATPFGSPENVVDLLNLALSPKHMRKRFPATANRTPPILHRDDFYVARKDGTRTATLKPGAIADIRRLAAGYFSYVFNIDPDHFPERKFAGVEVRGIPYLKFTLCQMQPQHAAEYAKHIGDTLPQHAEMLLDGAIRIGGKLLYSMRDIRDCTPAQLRSAGVEILTENEHEYLGGTFLRTDLQSFPKLHMLLKIVKHNIASGTGKMFVSDQRVSRYGILTIREMFRQNGVIESQTEPNEHTLCNVCAQPMRGHKAARGADTHAFSPVRMITMYGESDRASSDRKYNMYNARSNVGGEQFRLLLGSKKLNVGYDFEAIRYQIIVSQPDTIAEYLQLIGRSARTESHDMLPVEERNVQIYNLICVPAGYNPAAGVGYKLAKGQVRGGDEFRNAHGDILGADDAAPRANGASIDLDTDGTTLGADEGGATEAGEDAQRRSRPEPAPYEEELVTSVGGGDSRPRSAGASVYDLARYERLLREYSTIQQISAAIYADAIDAYINAPIIERSLHAASTFGAVHFPLAKRRPNPAGGPQFDAFYAEAEIRVILYTIKQLFALSRVYSVSDLWYRVQHPGFHTEYDPEQFARSNYEVAVCRLLHPTSYRSNSETYTRLADMADPVLLYGADPYYLHRIGDYYMALPSSAFQSGSGSRDQNEIGAISTTNVAPEMWNRVSGPQSTRVVLKSRLNIEENYSTLRTNFQRAFSNATWYQLMGSLEVYDEEFHKQLVEDCIKYVADLLSGAGKVSEHNDFYYRMLYFYNKLDLVLYADQLLTGADEYKGIIGPPQNFQGVSGPANRFLMSSVTNSETKFDLYRINKYVPPKHIVPANLLPVGHFVLSNAYAPRLYHPRNGWSTAQDYIERSLPNDVENDIIVGRYDKIPGSIELRFKLSKPLQKQVQHKDLRLNSRGIICTTENKGVLAKIATQLGLTITAGSARNICEQIKIELMKRELASHKAYHHEHRTNPNAKRVRWFYMHFES